MLAPPSTGETRTAAPPGPGILCVDQPYGSITAPLAFTASLRLTLEQFEEVCQANTEAVIELAADGWLIAWSPVGGEMCLRNAELQVQLPLWASGSGGWMALGSSTGFRLPDSSVLSPDVSLVALGRWLALTAEQRRGFPPLCPDLVVELASPSEASPSEQGPRGLTALRRKMAAYQRNGARLGWLLIPEERVVEVWGPHNDSFEPHASIAGGAVVQSPPCSAQNPAGERMG